MGHFVRTRVLAVRTVNAGTGIHSGHRHCRRDRPDDARAPLARPGCRQRVHRPCDLCEGSWAVGQCHPEEISAGWRVAFRARARQARWRRAIAGGHVGCRWVRAASVFSVSGPLRARIVRENSDMWLARPGITLIFAAGSIALILGCERGGGVRAKSDTTSGASEATPARTFAVSSQPLQPIPPDNYLARPKSLHQVGLPAALTDSVIPKDNPQTPEKIALGEKLFFDGRLSANGTVACASCHEPRLAFTDGRPV